MRGFGLVLVLTPIVILFGWSFIGLPVSAIGFLTISNNKSYLKIADKDTISLNKIPFMNKIAFILTIHLVIASLVSVPWIGGLFIPDSIMNKDFIGNMLVYIILSSALLFGYLVYVWTNTNKMPSYFDQKARNITYTEEDIFIIKDFIKKKYTYKTAKHVIDNINESDKIVEALGQIASWYHSRDSQAITTEEYNEEMKRTLKNIGIEDADY